MGPTGDQHRVLQIHPTRRCNLRCLHCYSSSAPEERDALPVTLLQDALKDAASEGFTVAGFSGGEPMLYKPLPELLDFAHEQGFATTVTSNGMLFDEPRVQMLAGRVDLLAISLDGTPASHNRMRASEHAFEIMAWRLANVRKAGIKFGFIFTLTQSNLDELEWVAQFALEQGAGLLQIHPLEQVGRAQNTLAGHRPDDTECAYAYAAATRLQQVVGRRMTVHLDLVHRGMLRNYPDRVFADQAQAAPGERLLAELVSPLVIEADGSLVPLGYGFARRYALGNLHQASFHELAADWRTNGYADFRALCREVFARASSSRELPYFNWYEAIGEQSLEPPLAARDDGERRSGAHG